MQFAIAANYADHNDLGALLDDISARGVRHVELPSGGIAGRAYCDPAALLQSRTKLRAFTDAFARRDLSLACLGAPGNCVHPNEAIARAHEADLRASIDLASALKLDHVVAFSGLPAGHRGDQSVSWPVSGICDEMYAIYQYQWDEVLIPFWRRMGAYAEDRGVKIAIEIHSGMSVHTPHTMLKLREATCDAICANIDTSHLWWQGIQPKHAIAILGAAGCIRHIHLRDARIQPASVDLYGLTGSYLPGDVVHRGWVFSALGRGHSVEVFSGILSALKTVGYQGLVSLEYADPEVDLDTGLNESIALCKKLIAREDRTYGI